MNKILTTMTFSALVAVAANSNAQFSIAPLTSFGGDGWLAPGEGGYAYLGSTGSNERGLAYGNGELYLVSRAGGNNVRRLNPLTGADLGGLNVTGISGGTFAVNAAAVGGDGALYVGNLTANSKTSPFKVYRWANNAATPTAVYSGDPFGNTARFGDTLAAIGSGANTVIAAGSGATTNVAENGFALINPTAGTSSFVTVAGTTDGDFRLGLDFVSPTQVIGTQGAQLMRYAQTDGTLLGTGTLSTGSQRPLGYAAFGGISLIASVDTVDGLVRIYDAANPASLGSPVLFGSALPFTHNSNANGAGAVTWGDAYYDSITGKWKSELYVLETNNGIQAYTIAVPEPTSAALLGLGVSALIAFRRNRK